MGLQESAIRVRIERILSGSKDPHEIAQIFADVRFLGCPQEVRDLADFSAHRPVELQHALVTPSDLPDSLLHYVIRTQESVILDDASTQNLNLSLTVRPHQLESRMGENRLSGSEGGAAPIRSSLPLSITWSLRDKTSPRLSCLISYHLQKSIFVSHLLFFAPGLFTRSRPERSFRLSPRILFGKH